MSAEASAWLQDACENLQVAEWCLSSALLNPCLQNSQQAVEKSIKALLAHAEMTPRRTHSIRELNRQVLGSGTDTGISEEECELLDSIYVSSKYPAESAVPTSPPTAELGRQCVAIARRALAAADQVVGEA